MEIVKELNLNGNPQVVKNGSLVYAENIRLSADGSFITNDEGFKKAIIETYGEEGEEVIPILKVKGIIAPNTVESIEGNIVGHINCPNEIVIFTSANKIYRLVECENYDELCVVPIESAWVYSNGKIVGTYIYNVNNELIIAIGESDAALDVPLYTINLNKSSNEDVIDIYTISPPIPIANGLYSGKLYNGEIPCGIYYFFIRYKISYDNYTDWYPIGLIHEATNIEEHTIINHGYYYDNVNIVRTRATLNLNNIKSNAPYYLQFNINFDTLYNYTNFQLGYILQHNDYTVGRIWKEYKIINNSIKYDIVFDAKNIKEISIDELIKNSFSVYNIKNITSFDNKLYIGNLKENNTNIINSNIEEIVNNIVAKQVIKPINENTIPGNSNTSNMTVGLLTGYRDGEPIYDYYEVSVYYDDQNNCYYNYISELTSTFKTGLNKFIQDDIPDATIDIIFNNISDARINFNIDRVSTVYFTGTNVNRNSINYTVVNGVNTYNFDFSLVGHQLRLNQIDKLNNDINNVYIKTLMPNEIYSFYVHFVKKDGSYTNGYKLQNKAWDEMVIPSTDIPTSPSYAAIMQMTLREIASLNPNITFYSNYNIYNIKDLAELQDVKFQDLYYDKGYIIDTRASGLIDDENLDNFYLYINSNGDKLFKTCKNINVNPTNRNKLDICQIGVQFSNIEIPEGYIGCFFSYEKIQPTVMYQGITFTRSTHIKVKANDAELGLTNYNGNLLLPLYVTTNNISNLTTDKNKYITSDNICDDIFYISNKAICLSDAATNFGNTDIDCFGQEGGIFFKLKGQRNEWTINDGLNLVCSIIAPNYNIYTNSNKELIPFGRILVKDNNVLYTYGETSTIISNDINYPSYIILDKHIIFKQSTYFSSEYKAYSNQNLGDNNIIQTSYAYSLIYPKVSNFNLNSLSIKKDSDYITTINSPNSWTNYASNNKILEAKNVSDLLELKSNYIYNQYKSYSNYDENLNYENVTPNMIRSSYPIRTESNENSWRKFDANDYYLIDKKAGEITNIFGIGKYFFIHTRNTLLIASADAKLTADNTTISVINHKLFDVAPSELFTSDLGFGGLKYKECQILSQHGYIWYDSDHHKIFRYDNSKLEDLTASIQEFIDYLKPEYCYFNLDNKTNRIFMCFITPNIGEITLTYSTLTNTFISVMDFTFDKNMHTTNNVYFTRSDISEIYMYDTTNFGLYELLGKLENGNTSVNDTQASFDVIINIGPETPKSLESIRWIHSYLADEYMNKQNYDNYAELKPAYPMNRLLTKHPDEKIYDLANVYIRIYNNNVDTGELSLFNDKLNRETIKGKNGSNYDDGYKYPHYEKGVWQFNYFRDNITQNRVTTPSDMKSLIYGTYFVIRFIFKNKRTVEEGEIHNKKLKFDSISTKINNY